MTTRAQNRRRSIIEAACSVETLETRRLMASTVSGNVWYDLNKDGTVDPGENPAEFITIFADANANGLQEPTEAFAVTGPAGNYALELPAGNFDIVLSQEHVPGDTSKPYRATSAPASGKYSVVSDNATPFANRNFGIVEGNVTGRVFKDVNGDGAYQAGEELENVEVFADENNNGVFDGNLNEQRDFTSPDGTYELIHLKGNLPLNIVANPAHTMRPTAPATGKVATTLTPGGSQANVNFAFAEFAAIGGQVFADTNKNGTRETGEALVKDVTVYADVNDNGTFDASEPSAVSTAALNPQLQNWVIRGISPGTYKIRIAALPSGYNAVTPTSNDATVQLGEESGVSTGVPLEVFALQPSGVIPPPPPPPGGAINDFNGDGTVDMVVQNGATTQVWLLGAPTASGQLKNIARSSVANLANPGAGWSVGGVGDFDGDKKPDVLYHNDATGANIVYTFNGVTKKGEINMPGLANTAWRTVTVGDFDKDNDADIMWRNSSTGQNTLWLLNNNVPSFKALPTAASQAWVVAGTGDYDGDGDRDILWYNHTTNRSSAWLIDTTQTKITPTFRGGPTLPAARASYRRLGVDDFDKDGISDVIWANPTNASQNTIWYLNQQTAATKIKGFGTLTGVA